MLKIAHVHQWASINGLPVEVINTILEAVTILNNEYGEDRDVDSGDGGFVNKETGELWVYLKGGKGEGIPPGEFIK